jgi:hypothetical protein
MSVIFGVEGADSEMEVISLIMAENVERVAEA